MAKNIYLIGGAMGVGKTAASQALKRKLTDSVFLDGDWCWDASPFIVTAETKSMVLDNICYLLNNFIKCSAYDNIIFCWVMHEQSIIDSILSGIKAKDLNIHCVSLVCSEEALIQRLKVDIENEVRAENIIEKSLSYLPLYKALTTEKIDVSNLTPEQTADIISKL